MRPVGLAALSLALLVITPTLGEAQLCAGSPALAPGRYHTAVSAVGHTYATALEASLTTGTTFFKTLRLGRAHDADMHATAYDLGADAGYGFALGAARRFVLCPTASFTASFGPHDYALSEYGYRTLDGGVGLGLGVVAYRSERVSILPAAGVSARRVRITRIPPGTTEQPFHMSDDYGLAFLAVGLTVHDRLVIRPTLSIPFGLAPYRRLPGGHPVLRATPFGREDQEVSLGLGVGYLFGGRR